MALSRKATAGAAPLNRRDLLWLLATAGAGIFGGSSLSWALERDEAARLAEAKAAAVADTLLSTGDQVGELTQTLAGAQAEVTRLTAELTIAQGQAAEYLNALTESQNSLAAAETELTALREQLLAAQTENQNLHGLVALFDNLDAIGLDGILQGGLVALTGAWGGLGLLAPVLQAGLELGRGLVDQFDETLMGLREKIAQVGKVIDNVSLNFDVVQAASAQAVLQVGPLYEPISRFAEFVIEKLPFGVGEKIGETLLLMQDLILGLPEAVRDTRQLLLHPFARYVGDQEGSWTNVLTKPIREKVFTPADEFLTQWSATEATLNEQLIAPANTALEARAALRAQIVAYKVERKLA